MRSCDDGYPSCRHAEATREWCKGDCKAQKEIHSLKAEIRLLQEIVADSADWAITELPSRTEPRWLVDARKYLGTD